MTELVGYISIVIKLIVGLSILNVWLVQPKKATKWRGGNAKTLLEEFEVYNLSRSFCYFVGFLKVGLSLMLIASIYFENLTLGRRRRAQTRALCVPSSCVPARRRGEG